jgi:hypothetical protein
MTRNSPDGAPIGSETDSSGFLSSQSRHYSQALPYIPINPQSFAGKAFAESVFFGKFPFRIEEKDVHRCNLFFLRANIFQKKKASVNLLKTIFYQRETLFYQLALMFEFLSVRITWHGTLFFFKHPDEQFPIADMASKAETAGGETEMFCYRQQ